MAKFIHTLGLLLQLSHNDHVLVDKRRFSNVVDARSFRGTDYDTDHYLLVAKVEERLSLSKQTT
jgi:hypothetical protein